MNKKKFNYMMIISQPFWKNKWLFMNQINKFVHTSASYFQMGLILIVIVVFNSKGDYKTRFK